VREERRRKRNKKKRESEKGRPVSQTYTKLPETLPMKYFWFQTERVPASSPSAFFVPRSQQDRREVRKRKDSYPYSHLPPAPLRPVHSSRGGLGAAGYRVALNTLATLYLGVSEKRRIYTSCCEI
jgi:hypothetical protein